MIEYFNGSYLEQEQIKISPDDRGYTFADGAYDVFRIYHGKLFTAQEHINRLYWSLGELQINLSDSLNFENIAHQLIERNNLQNTDSVVYIQVTRGVAPRKHPFPGAQIEPSVYVKISEAERPFEKNRTGGKIITLSDNRWLRCDIKSLSLLPNVLASQNAKEQGADEAVFIRDGIITEGSHTNFFAVIDNQLITHPESNFILAGITRQLVFKICCDLNISYQETTILENKLYTANEIFISGTTTEILPIIKVNDQKINNGKLGPITCKIQKEFDKMVCNI